MSIIRRVWLTMLLAFSAASADEQQVLPPPQDQGLPYTRSSQHLALASIHHGIAVFPGSRYAYVYGNRVRLSETDLLRGEAVADGEDVLVPTEFALLVAGDSPSAPAVPADLAPIANRWVYAPSDFQGRAAELPKGVSPVTINRHELVSLRTLSQALGKRYTRLASGVVFLGNDPPDLGSRPLGESVVTLFDTPEKFANPDIATTAIPSLSRQGKWTEHVKASASQLANLEGPESPWPGVSKENYRAEGINTALFGSDVPPPGVYPRVLFSDRDLPAIAARVKDSVTGQMALIEMEELFKKSWWDPSTSDGQIFLKLSSGDLSSLEWDIPISKPLCEVPQIFRGQKPGIYNTHVAYVPECLTAMALYCLLTDNNELGKKVATAIANYYVLREPLLDEWLQISDSEFGSSLKAADGSFISMDACGATTHWRGTHALVAHMNLGLALDFAGKWMSEAQKDSMRRFIAKATYGRRSYGQDSTPRFRDVNWMAWDLTHFLAVTAIEGLPGFDPEVYAAGQESARAFCDWGVDPDGVIYESNGKTGGGLQFQLLSMVACARRGENLFAHPHWRKLLESQVQTTSPPGRVVPNSGTQFVPYSRERMSLGFVSQMKSFYPQSRLPDYLITAAFSHPEGTQDEPSRIKDQTPFNPDAYRARVKAMPRLRLPGVTYPGFGRAILYDADVIPTTRADLGLPLDFDAPVHGVHSAYSSALPDATWIHLMVRPDHYIGAGHHHSDSGMFHFSALGVDWITESAFSHSYSGNFHNLVLVDGLSQPNEATDDVPKALSRYNAPGTYLGAVSSEAASAASADLSYAYSWRWNTQPPPTWNAASQALGWELDPSPALAKIFAGTARYKLRTWAANSNASNYMPTARAPFNPMQRVFRTVGLVRGAHPYGFVIDDVKKDQSQRLYQWTAMLAGGVCRANVSGLPPNAMALAKNPQDPDPKSQSLSEEITPKPGDPVLLIFAAGATKSSEKPILDVERIEGPPDRNGTPQFSNRVVINHFGISAAFRVFLLPTRFGEPLPLVTWDEETNEARIGFPEQSDAMKLSSNPDQPPRFRVTRAGKRLLDTF